MRETRTLEVCSDTRFTWGRDQQLRGLLRHQVHLGGRYQHEQRDQNLRGLLRHEVHLGGERPEPSMSRETRTLEVCSDTRFTWGGETRDQHERDQNLRGLL